MRRKRCHAIAVLLARKVKLHKKPPKGISRERMLCKFKVTGGAQQAALTKVAWPTSLINNKNRAYVSIRTCSLLKS